MTMTVVQLNSYKTYKQYEAFYQSNRLNLNSDNRYIVKKDFLKEYTKAWIKLLNQRTK